MTTWIAGLGCLLLTCVILLLIRVTRHRRLSNLELEIAAFGCLAAFMALNISDWPAGWLSSFWREHSIVGATIDTLLLGAVIYLSYKASDLRLQEDLDKSIAVAGRAGVVDHLVEVDVALALACAERRTLDEGWPTWDDHEWDEHGKALGWLRQNREVIYTDAGKLRSCDPRSWPIPSVMLSEEWRRRMVDACIRRVMAAIRDWAVVLTRSRDGQKDLVKLGDIRLQLVEIDDLLETEDITSALAAVEKCQEDCRTLAFAFELASKPHTPRPEVVHCGELPARQISPRKHLVHGHLVLTHQPRPSHRPRYNGSSRLT